MNHFRTYINTQKQFKRLLIQEQREQIIWICIQSYVMFTARKNLFRTSKHLMEFSVMSQRPSKRNKPLEEINRQNKSNIEGVENYKMNLDGSLMRNVDWKLLKSQFFTQFDLLKLNKSSFLGRNISQAPVKPPFVLNLR